MYPNPDVGEADPEARRMIEMVPMNQQDVLVSALSARSNRTNDDDIDVRIIFDRYDTNQDGFLDTREIKALIRGGQADDIRQSVVRRILRHADEDNDGRLSFDEFLNMHKRYRWVLRDMSRQYTNIVPHQQRNQMRPKHVPWLMVLIMFLQSVIQMFISIYFKGNEDNLLYEHLQFQQNAKTQVWRFVTYMLVHSGFEHFAGNMMLQLILGIPLEIYNGWWRVLIVYLAGGIAGCLGHAVFKASTLRGASGGDFALLTAHIASVIINWRELEHGLVQIFLSIVYCIISWIVGATSSSGDSVSHIAHLFGGIAGLLVGFCVLLNLNIKRWENTLKIVSLTTFSVLSLIGVVYLMYTEK